MGGSTHHNDPTTFSTTRPAQEYGLMIAQYTAAVLRAESTVYD